MTKQCLSPPLVEILLLKYAEKTLASAFLEAPSTKYQTDRIAW
jgi:hypothetical protein